ncbi:MAG: dimethyl sulfoxide reductase anchor subunit [Gammaproteobacteria bacterium]|nr:dimethyl sulfoxide reductase anchor subunit [Gammaproteobacteria bacterium]
MHPAFSVIFLTTLIGVAQGLFTALMIGQTYELSESSLSFGNEFYMTGAILVLFFMGGGLIASFFHLGRPERAWRSATMWRTSWLSREVIAIPLFMFITFIYAYMQYTGSTTSSTLLVGLLGVIASFILFYCTGMIYACLPFLREWATPLTIVNFILFGTASGFSFAAFYAATSAPELIGVYASFAIVLTLMGWATRVWTLRRNAALKPKTTTQTAIGAQHPQVKQVSQGQMGGSYNTREFFHHKTAATVSKVKSAFLILAFPVPVVLLFLGMFTDSSFLLLLAFVTQYAGLVAERWYFFVQVNHPQNLYYQTIS